MRWLATSMGIAALIGSALGQDEIVPVKTCDALGRCFSTYVTDGGVSYGVAIPANVTEAPFDTILQVTAPITIGWAGFAWGGAMTYNPLAIAWLNGKDVTVSSRMGFGYFAPPAYVDAEYTVLPGTVVNATHFQVTALCKGCSYWAPFGSDPVELSATGENYLAFAYSNSPVDEPANNETTFGIHDRVGHWVHDFGPAQTSLFDTWAAASAEGKAPESPATSSTLLTSTTTPPQVSTTFSTVIAPAPTSVVVAPLPLPSACRGVTAPRFALGTANGWKYTKLAGGLSRPRGILLDRAGNLLVVQAGLGLSGHVIGPDGCISSTRMLIQNPTLNHGLELSVDGNMLYVSSSTTAWAYTYDAVTMALTNQTVVVKGMYNGGHPTRTLLIPPKTPNLLVVSQGSLSNFDMPSLDINTARAVVKVFDLSKTPAGGYDYNTGGWFFGYGLRNEVAIVADSNNMVWGVENSGDDFARTINGQSTDIHMDNPAEELNFLGDPSKPNEKWYGYPTCFTVWEPSIITDKAFKVGEQFVVAPNATFDDDTCIDRSTPPRLSFQAHSAPIDAKFDKDYSNMYVSLHGSWNRQPATGYKVVQIPFTKGIDGSHDPVAPPDSNEGYNDIFWSENVGACTGSNCLRPSGLVFDKAFLRLFVASDASQEGEIFILYK